MNRHIPVLLNEAISALGCNSGKIYVDGTLGGCGHAIEILRHTGPDGLLIGLDADRCAIENARLFLEEFGSRVLLFHANFAQLGEVLVEAGIDAVDGIVVDLGISLYQLEKSGKGFSFLRDEPLDMRMNDDRPLTAAEIVNKYSRNDLKEIFWKYGEERWSGRIAHAICSYRKTRPILYADQLANIVRSAIPRQQWPRHIDAATRSFQALRIKVNDELSSLSALLDAMPEYLKPRGRFVAISFHSLEDRLIKNALTRFKKGCLCPADIPKCNCGKKPLMNILTSKPVQPGAAEVAKNPKARSAKLRAAERL
ncbi:MAG: 16S rRNA (cytosine(1402)-N(4))-methyltransferase RsmH [Pseudomonadota bacterium]